MGEIKHPGNIPRFLMDLSCVLETEGSSTLDFDVWNVRIISVPCNKELKKKF